MALRGGSDLAIIPVMFRCWFHFVLLISTKNGSVVEESTNSEKIIFKTLIQTCYFYFRYNIICQILLQIFCR